MPPKPTAYALGLVGLLLLVSAALVAKSTYELEQTGIRTQGVVVQLERSGDSHYPVFKFRDVKGRVHTIRSNVSAKTYFKGDAVPILYDPDSPLDAEVDEFLMLYLMPGILGLLGILFLFGMFMVAIMLPFFEKAYEKQRVGRGA